MDIRTTFFTYAGGRYEMFALPYAVGILHHNDDARVEICVDDLPRFRSEYGRGIDLINETYGRGRFLVRGLTPSVALPSQGRFAKHAVRFIEQPHERTPYVYIGDVDILVLESGITDGHVADMEMLGLPYSNRCRAAGTNRLSGLHFSEWNAYYPQPDMADFDFLSRSDEQLLYEMVTRRGHALPAEGVIAYRPWHGLHIADRSNIFSRLQAQSIMQIGLKDRMLESYLRLRASGEWQRIRPHFHRTYQSWLDLIDSATSHLPDDSAYPYDEHNVIYGPLRGRQHVGLIDSLVEFAQENSIKTVKDLGCGDPFWLLYAARNFDRYTGIDLDPAITEANRQRYGSTIATFKTADARTAELAPSDLVILRDMLNVNSHKDSLSIIRNALNSGCRFLAATNHIRLETEPIFRRALRSGIRFITTNGGGRPLPYRKIGLGASPYNFPKSLADMKEGAPRRGLKLGSASAEELRMQRFRSGDTALSVWCADELRSLLS